MPELPRIIQHPKIGTEPLHLNGQQLHLSVIDFWRWSASDLLSNATRGRLAEFIVAAALHIPFDQVRDEWGAYELLMPEDIRVEVKSAAYVQSWYQSKRSVISFRVPKTRAWDAETNLQALESCRQAEVYVFALLAHDDQTTIDPLDVSQWEFYVLPTSALDARTRSQHSITLPTLRKLAEARAYGELKHEVQIAAAQHRAAVQREEQRGG